MSEITRRRLLGNAAVGAGGALASSFLPPALARAAARGPQKGSLKDVEHVVVHMQENRSFDHYFGTLAGVRGSATRTWRSSKTATRPTASRSSISTTR